MSDRTAESDAPACECPTDDYCPKCHPRWYAKWRERNADYDADYCPGDHAGPCFPSPGMCADILREGSDQ